jgi:hypothetical protein
MQVYYNKVKKKVFNRKVLQKKRQKINKSFIIEI